MTAAPPGVTPARVQVGDAEIFHYDLGRGPAIVMLHGFNHHAEAFSRNLHPLADAGFRVLALDLPGFGRSGVPAMSYSLAGYGRFISAYLDVVGVEAAHLIGSSMGGAIALMTAVDHPDRVLTVTGAAPAGMFASIPWVWKLSTIGVVQAVVRPFMGRRRLIEESHRRAYYDRSLSTPVQTEIMAEAYQQPGYRDHILAMGQSMFLAEDHDRLWAGMPEIAAPTMVVWGRQDRTLPLAHAYRAAQHMPRAELVIYDHCGHLPMYEHADEFNRDVAAFLTRTR